MKFPSDDIKYAVVMLNALMDYGVKMQKQMMEEYSAFGANPSSTMYSTCFVTIQSIRDIIEQINPHHLKVFDDLLEYHYDFNGYARSGQNFRDKQSAKKIFNNNLN